MKSQMALDSFTQEIEDRKRREIAQLDAGLSEKVATVSSNKRAKIGQLQEQFSSEAKVKSEREAARIVEEARLQAKKTLFDAINSNLVSAIDATKNSLNSYTQKPQYKKALISMADFARKKLGDDMTIHCREEDKAIFKDPQSGVRFTLGTPIKTIGGIIAENKGKTKEIDLTFEELLRTHEDEIKNILLERMME